MGGLSRWRRLVGGTGASVLALGLLTTGGATTAANAFGAVAGAGAVPAIGVHVPRVAAGRVDPAAHPHGKILFSCQKPTAQLVCYGPDQIRHAYGVDKLINAGYTGKGKTIVIIDAFQSPTLARDVAIFDQVFGLPNPRLSIVAPEGLTPFDPKDANQVGWAGEISLDVEWAHAIAPQARIVLALAKDNQDGSLQAVQQYVVAHRLGDVVSQSFGEAEACYGVNTDGTRQPGVTLAAEHSIFRAAAHKNMTVFASAGDNGAAEPTCDNQGLMKAASTPASDPLVTGVGGTELFANPRSGAYHREIVWNQEADFGVMSVGGGGISSVYAEPSWQRRVAGDLPGRGVPDVAYNAAINHGVLGAFSVNEPPGTFFIFGGTSAGSPQWSGLTAIADQINGHDVGFINPTLYSIDQSMPGDFHDVTRGNNSDDGITGFNAMKGWDPASGLGSPVANRLIPALAAAK